MNHSCFNRITETGARNIEGSKSYLFQATWQLKHTHTRDRYTHRYTHRTFLISNIDYRLCFDRDKWRYINLFTNLFIYFYFLIRSHYIHWISSEKNAEALQTLYKHLNKLETTERTPRINAILVRFWKFATSACKLFHLRSAAWSAAAWQQTNVTRSV